MRILMTNTGPWGTGSFTVINAVVDELIALGHEVKVFFPDNGDTSEDKEKYYDSDLYEIWQFPISNDKAHLETFPLMIADPHPRNPHGKTFKALKASELMLYQDSCRAHLEKIIADFKPDIIECQHIWFMDHVIHNMGYPFVSVAHHSDQMGFKYDERMQPIAKQSAELASYIFSISEYVTEEVIELYGVEREKVITLPNGYDQKVFKKKTVNRQQLLEKLGCSIPDDAPIVSFAGKISRTKGIDVLLRANGLLDPKDNIHFLILGSGDIERTLELDIYKEYEFERIHFIGQQIPETVASIHNISKVSVMPSRSEGFGIAGLEAMGCEIPLITTRSGGPETFAVGDVVEPANHQQLADAIKRIIHMEEYEYGRLCQKAFTKAKQYSWRTNTESRIEYYHKTKELTMA